MSLNEIIMKIGDGETNGFIHADENNCKIRKSNKKFSNKFSFWFPGRLMLVNLKGAYKARLSLPHCRNAEPETAKLPGAPQESKRQLNVHVGGVAAGSNKPGAYVKKK